MINMTIEEFHTALYALVDSSHTVIINDGTTDGISLINGKINVHNIKITSERFYMDDGTNKLLALRYADLTGVDVSSVTDLHQCFTDVHYGMSVDIVISNWDTSNVTNMSQMFYAYRGTSLDTRGLDTHNVTDMSNMFEKCSANIINLSTFDTSSVTNDTDMFLDCTTTRIVVDVDKWTLDTSSGVFYNYNGKVYIGDTEIMTKANSDRDIATSLNSALANYDNKTITAEKYYNKTETYTKSEIDKKIFWGSFSFSSRLGGGYFNLDVQFDTPLNDDNYAVALVRRFDGSYFTSVELAITSKTKNGFHVLARNDGSTTENIPKYDYIVVCG